MDTNMTNWVRRPWTADRVLLWSARGLLAIWAGFWLWFNAASAIGEEDGLWHHITLAAIIAGVTTIAWVWPRIGGVVLIGAAVLGASLFPNPWALGLLAAPAAVIGVLLLLVRK